MSSDLKLLLNGEWEFAQGADGQPPVDGWGRVRVPHRSREFEDEPPESGWYRSDVRVPADWPGGDRRIVLDLGRVRHFGRAYLNGEAIGEHFGMRLPWRLDLSSRVEGDASCELLVYTHNCEGRYAHPDVEQLSEDAELALDTRFWRTSAATIGMESDVWLCQESAVRLEDPHIVTSVRERTLAVELTVRNDSGAPFEGRVRFKVTREGRTELELPACEAVVAAGSAVTVQTAAPWADPVIWGRPPYGEPVLYFLRAELEGGEGTLFSDSVRFGFREIWAEGDRLLLNGDQLMPWGDHTVPYVYERQWLTRKFIDLADGNISIVEHHRYDPPPVFHDVADELGVFVVGANFCVGTGQVPPALDETERQLVMDHHLAVADYWIRSVRNHPSILFWDITDARDPQFCVPLLRKVKELDRTRIAEVTFDHQVADDELIDLIDCYRLFSGLENIEASIEAIRAGLPVKPIRVGEAGIFEQGEWGEDEDPPLKEGFWDFLMSLPERNIHGLQTFFLADMDYRGFTDPVPGMLAGDLEFEVSWPSQSGMDARIDPFGESTKQAWGKARLCLNWCDPDQPVARHTATHRWAQEVFRNLAKRDVGPLATERMPEVIVHVRRDGEAVAGAQVFSEPIAGQGFTPFGVLADSQGTSWFALSEPGRCRFRCGDMGVEVETSRQQIGDSAGYDHIQHVFLDIP